MRPPLCAGLVLAAASILCAQPPKPSPAAIKAFTAVPEWVLEITWHAKDDYEDGKIKGGVEMTATARYYLKPLDRRNDWGRWEAQKEQTSTFTYTAFLIQKKTGQRTDWKALRPMPDMTSATFQVGGHTPGYQLDCQAMFPSRASGSGIPPAFADLQPVLVNTTTLGNPPQFCTGPLPTKGTVLSGSMVNIAPVGPFCGGAQPPPMPRVSVQYVLTPAIPVTPLKPVP